MTWLSDEQSVHSGRPIELYKFVGPGSYVYHYTSHHDSVSFGGDTYSPQAIRREAVPDKGVSGGNVLKVEFPVALQLAQDYAFLKRPSSLALTVYRNHGSNSRVWWTGAVTDWSVDGMLASAHSTSLFDRAMSTNLPTIWYITLCGHRLYDGRCGISEASFAVATTVASVSSDGYEVTLTSDGGNPDQWMRSGRIVRTTDGDHRWIVDHTGNVLTLDAPFLTLNASDAVTAYAGCSHDVTTCRDKFSNVNRFGGMPYIPSSNLFNSRWGIRGV